MKIKKIIIISTISILFIGLIITSITFGIKLNNSIKQNNTLTTEKLNLTLKVLDLEKEITKQKEATASIQKDLDISNDAGKLIASITVEIEDLYYRYDDVFVKTYNYCKNNVEWNYAGVVDMNSFLKEQQKIQNDYTSLINRLNSTSD
jgi:hypothetical protein